jgi:uncharacterized cupredoxin-like copper-binding protein
VIARAALLPLAAGLVVLVTTACGGGAGASAEATIVIHYSHFVPASITVPVGAPVTFTLRNEDPIEHEWIVGSPDVHERHRTGTEPFHDQIPTEVTVPALESRTTTVTFELPGEYLYICHLPGHEAYGMVGRVHAVGD